MVEAGSGMKSPLGESASATQLQLPDLNGTLQSSPSLHSTNSASALSPTGQDGTDGRPGQKQRSSYPNVVRSQVAAARVTDSAGFPMSPQSRSGSPTGTTPKPPGMPRPGPPNPRTRRLCAEGDGSCEGPDGLGVGFQQESGGSPSSKGPALPQIATMSPMDSNGGSSAALASPSASSSAMVTALTPRSRASLLANRPGLKSAGTVKDLSSHEGAAPAVVHLGSSQQGFCIRISQATENEDEEKAKLLDLARRRSVAAELLGVQLSSVKLELDKDRDAAHLGHEAEVLSMVFSPDGSYLLAGGRNCEVILWELASKTRKVSASMDSSIVAVAYAPSGRYFAAADMDSDIKVWDSTSLEEVGYESLAPSVLSLAMCSGRAEIMATGSTSRSVLVLAVPGLEKIAELRHDGHVRSVAFSPDGAYLAGGGGIPDSHGSHGSHASGHAGPDQETKTVVWSIGEKTMTLSATDLNVSMASADNGPASFLSDNPIGGATLGFAYMGAISFESVVHSVAFSPSAKLLAVGSESPVISLLLVSQGFESAARLPCSTGTRGLAWCPDSRFLASAGDDLQVCVWDVILERVLFSLPKVKDWLCSMCFSPDSQWLACCGYSGHEVAVYPLRCVDELGEILQAAQDAQNAIKIMPTVSRKGEYSPSDSDGASEDEDALHVPPEIATAPMRNQVPRITAIAVKDSLHSNTGYELEYRDPQFATRASDSHNASKGRCTTAADSVWGVVVGVLSTSQCFMPSPSQPPRKLAHEDEVLTMAVSCDQTKIAAGGEDQALVVWDLTTMEKLFELKLRFTLAAVTFGNARSKHLVACAFGSQVALVDTSTQQEVARSQVSGTALSLAVSSTPPGLLAVGTSASSVLLLSLDEPLTPLATLKTGGHVHSLHFSPITNFLVAGGGIDDKCGLMTHKADISGTQAVVWKLDAVSLESSSVQHSTSFSDVVRAVQFSPCGKLLALGGESQTIKVLITQQDYASKHPGFDDGTTLNCMAGVRCLAWSDNSHFLASGGEDMQVSVWDILTGSVAFRLPKSADWISSLAFCADGAWLATSGFGQCEVVLHPLDKCNNDALDQGEYGYSPAMARRSMFGRGTSPHNTPVSSRLNSKRPADYVSEPSRADPAARAAAASCISNNTRLLSVMLGMDLGAVTMEVAQGRASRELAHSDEVMSLAFSSSGRRLVAADEDSRVKLWDLETDQPLLDTKLEASVVAVAYSPNDCYFVAATSENTLMLWDAGTQEEVITQEEEGGIHALALLSKPQELLAVGLKSKKVLIMSIPGLDTLVELNHGGDVRSLCFSNDGSLLAAAGGADDMHGLMTVKSGGPDRGMRAMVWEVPESGSDFEEAGCLEFNNVLHASAFSPSSKILAVGGESSKIAILLVDKAFEQVSELSCAAGVRCLGWCGDSRFLASGGEDLQVCVWDVKSERLVLRLPKARDWLNCVAFSPDNCWLASCGYGSSSVQLHAVEVKHDDVTESMPQQLEHEESEAEMGGTVSLSMSVPDINTATPTWVKLDDGDATLSLAIPSDL